MSSFANIKYKQINHGKFNWNETQFNPSFSNTFIERLNRKHPGKTPIPIFKKKSVETINDEAYKKLDCPFSCNHNYSG